MSESFKPIAERARWRMIYDLFRKAETGQVVAYAEMAEALDLDPVADRHAMQMAARRAAVELERVDCRAVTAVRGEGYRVVHGDETLGMAHGRRRRAARQVGHGRRHVETGLSAPETGDSVRQALHALGNFFDRQAEFARIQARKIARLEREAGVYDKPED